MNFLQNPDWIKAHNYNFIKFDDVPESVFESINMDLRRIIGNEPIISILIAAWNEEINILRCISALSKSNVPFKIEIIIVDNNSKDKTSEAIKKLYVTGLFEGKQGTGPARQLGLENCNGKYTLLADADCFYHPDWIFQMYKNLSKKNVSCVYGRYSFISEPGFPRWKLYLFEKMRDIMGEIRHINRPYLNAYGLNFGFVTQLALKIGFVQNNLRMDDGVLCLNLMEYGKVVQVRNNRIRAWTGPRTLLKDNQNFTKVLLTRITREIKRANIYLSGRVSEEDYRRKS